MKQANPHGMGTWEEFLLAILGAALGGLMAFGLIFWVVMFLNRPDNPVVGGTSITIATAVAIFGAFAWAGGISLRRSPLLCAKLRRIGLTYTFAALFLVMMGMLLPVIEVLDTSSSHYWWFAILYVIFTFLAAAAVGYGTYMLTTCIVLIWKL